MVYGSTQVHAYHDSFPLNTTKNAYNVCSSEKHVELMLWLKPIGIIHKVVKKQRREKRRKKKKMKKITLLNRKEILLPS